jgi:hypothetical protein
MGKEPERGIRAVEPMSKYRGQPTEARSTAMIGITRDAVDILHRNQGKGQHGAVIPAEPLSIG